MKTTSRAIPLGQLTSVVLLVCVILGFRLIGAEEKRSAVWNMDEAISACAANSINSGGVPYRDAVDHRGPVTYYLYSLIFKLSGRNNMSALHMVLALLAAGIAAAVLVIGRVDGGWTTGLIAMAVFVLLSCVGAEGYDLLAFHTEWPMVGFTALAMLAVLRWSRHDQRWLLVVAGFLFGGAFLSKQVGALDLGAAAVFVTLSGLSRGRDGRQTLVGPTLLVTGALVPVVAVFGYFAHRDALHDAWFYIWTYNTEFYMAPISRAMQFAALDDMWIDLVDRGLAPVVAAAVIGVIVAIGDARAAFRRPTPRTPAATVLFAGWLVTSWIGASYSTRGFGHYFIPVFVPLSLLVAVALVRVGSALHDHFIAARHDTNPGIARLRRPVLIVSVGALVIYSCSLLSINYTWFAGGWGHPYLPVSTFISDHSSRDDTIFVWGFVPEIYVQSDRNHASRFTFCNQVTGLVPWVNIHDPDTDDLAVPGAFKTMMTELESARPRFIVDTSIGDVWGYGKYPISKYPRLAAFIREHYREAGIHIDPSGEPRLRLFRRVDQP